MKKGNTLRLLSLAICLLVFVGTYAQPEPPAGKYWEVEPKFTDEFDSFDDNKWYKEMWDYDNTPVHMVLENAGVTDGKLWIKATQADDITADKWMLSSRVASKVKIRYPMYMECHMKANSISSYNTFWLNNGDDQNRDEIDMCESNANPSMAGKEAMAYTLNSQYFIVENGVTERAKGNFDSHNLSDDNPLQGVHWDEAYHTIGIWWKDAHNVQFYLNGEEAGSVTSTKEFTRYQAVIWDVWTQNTDWVGGLPDKDDLLDDTKNTMYVDWIHTYRLKDISSDASDVEVKNADVYPNPAVDILNIDLANDSNDAIANIYNKVGQLVLSQKLEDVSNQISIEELPSGIYIVQTLNGNTVSTQKVVIE